MNFVIPSERHQKSLEYAVNKASASPIFPYIYKCTKILSMMQWFYEIL